MDSVVKFLQPYQLHPVVDHFSVALLFVAVLIDLVASAAPTRIWLRYTAVMLMILGALSAGASFATGDMEADRIWNALGQPAKDVLKTHAELGEYLAIAFGVLALWALDSILRLRGGDAPDLSDCRGRGDRGFWLPGA